MKLQPTRALSTQLRDRAANALGPDWAADKRPDAHPISLIHLPTQLEFCVVAGGSMQMGLLAEEAELVDLFLGHMAGEVFGDAQQRATPSRPVAVAPFVCGAEVLTPDEIKRLLPQASANGAGEMRRSEALELATHAGFRLPSEAELEWLARDGHQATFVLDVATEAPEDDEDHVVIVPRREPQGRFGIHDLFSTQWAADAWFEDHDGAPPDATARTGGDPQGVRKFEAFDYADVGDEAVSAMLSARRDPGRDQVAGVRLALSLP